MPTPPPDPGRHRLRALFVRGLAVLLPTVLTLALLALVVRFIDDYVARPINRSVYWSLSSNDAGRAYLRWTGVDVRRAHDFLDVNSLPPELRARYERDGSEPDPARPRAHRFSPGFLEALEARRPSGFFTSLESLFADREKVYQACSTKAFPPILGFVLSLALVFVIGFLASGFLGRRILRHFEEAVFNIPIVRRIYPHARQIVDFFFSEDSRKRAFRAVVAVPYPHRDTYALAFLVGEGVPGLTEQHGRKFVTVFVPSSPTPFTGYTIFVRSEDVITLSITVEDALKIVVSGGVLTATPTALVGTLQANSSGSRPEAPRPDPVPLIPSDRA